MACRVRQANSAIGFRVGTATAASGDTPHTDPLDADWGGGSTCGADLCSSSGPFPGCRRRCRTGKPDEAAALHAAGQVASLYALAFQIASSSLIDRFVPMLDMEPESGATPARNRYQTRSSQPTPLRYDRMVSQFYAVPTKRWRSRRDSNPRPLL